MAFPQGQMCAWNGIRRTLARTYPVVHRAHCSLLETAVESNVIIVNYSFLGNSPASEF